VLLDLLARCRLSTIRSVCEKSSGASLSVFVVESLLFENLQMLDQNGIIKFYIYVLCYIYDDCSIVSPSPTGSLISTL
jgi:hypothetical protein